MTQVLLGDAQRLPLRTASVAAIVTSPPYNAGVDYDGVDDQIPWGDYLDLVQRSAREMARVLIPCGRAWVNVMRSGPDREAMNGTIPGHQVGRTDLAQVWTEGLERAGLTWRETVVWVQDSYDAACAWGSWRQPSAPNLRGAYEIILLFHKGPWKRPAPAGHEGWKDDLPGWEDLTRNVWKIPPAPRNDHPAPYPDELARRCIRLSTWPGETVLDPFVGSGTTLRAARDLGRQGIGVDLSPAYVRLARQATAQGVLL